MCVLALSQRSLTYRVTSWGRLTPATVALTARDARTLQHEAALARERDRVWVGVVYVVYHAPVCWDVRLATVDNYSEK